MARKTPLFHRAHYNILAAQIRRGLEDVYKLPEDSKYDRGIKQAMMGTLTVFALDLAKRFVEDNPKKPGDDVYYFRPLKFLDACSPDPERMPLSELWEG